MSDPPLSLRPATKEDSLRLWDWRNEASTRAASFSTEPIPYADHKRWFGLKLRDPNTRIFIALNPIGEAVGYVRFEIAGAVAEVSVSIDPGHRGRGYGSCAIRLGARQILTEGEIRHVVARVREDNGSSIAAFRGAGFVLEGRETVRGVPALRLIYGMREGQE